MHLNKRSILKWVCGGAAAVVMASGVLLGVIALAIYPMKAVRQLENKTPGADERSAL